MKIRSIIFSFMLVFLSTIFASIVHADYLDNWTLRTTSTSYSFNGITCGNGTFVAVGRSGDSSLILTSPDGISWASKISGITNSFNSAVYATDIGGGRYVVVGSNGAILISQDAENWTIISSGATYDLNKIIYKNGLFVAVGANSEIITSPDGITWTQVLSGTYWTSASVGVAYGNSIFATLGYTSSDGSTWTPTGGLVTYPDIIFNDMSFGNGVFVAVGGIWNFGLAPPEPIQIIITSPDGIQWAIQVSGELQMPLKGLVYENNTFIAVGSDGTILTSYDGIAWAVKNSGTTNNLSGIAYGNNTFVAVGDNGTIIQSDTLCTASLAGDFSLSVPIINLDTTYLTVDMQYLQATTDSMFEVTSAGSVLNPVNYNGCQAATLISENGIYKLHIPKVNYQNSYYTLDLEYVPTSDGKVWFRVNAVTVYQ